ncbi:MAG: ATP-binding protein [Oscillospiraceae bacterium]|nr:ATP-binding protein [Oscillospiraceae bacterium]
MYIERAIEKELSYRFFTSKAVAVTGARQVGKTTVTRHLFPEIRRINMKDSRLSNAAKEDPFSFLDGFGRPLFIDEVQAAPYLFNDVKVILDELGGKGNYLFSGSQKWELMKGLSESLAGSVSILEMATLSMREIFQVSFNLPFIPTEEYLREREQKLIKYKDVWQYIHNGFYPELYDDTPRRWEVFYRDYIATYMERDVYDILKIRDHTTFYRLLVSVAARTGSMLNYSNIADDIGVDSETVKSWIGVLENTGIVYILQPYYNSHLNRAIKTPKIYFRDTGLAAYLTNWMTKEQLRDGAMNGAFFETFVINEIIKSYINAGKDYSKYLYYYRGKDKKKNGGESFENEIDFIIEDNDVLYPIEIKKNSTVKSDMAAAFPVLDKAIEKRRGPGTIICTSDYKLKLRENLLALPIEYI